MKIGNFWKLHLSIGLVSNLLYVPHAKLGHALCNSSQDSGFANGPVERAEKTRDAFVRALYTRLVDWFVNSLNTCMCLGRKVLWVPQLYFCALDSCLIGHLFRLPISGEKYTIGLMDPAGFDSGIKGNPFSKMISNCVNEQMLYHYTQSIFVMEEVKIFFLFFFANSTVNPIQWQQDCAEEDIKTKKLKFSDNRETMASIMGKPEGLLSIIDDNTKSSSAVDGIGGTRIIPINERTEIASFI